jgi:FdhD protein
MPLSDLFSQTKLASLAWSSLKSTMPRHAMSPAGALFPTSRVSIELVQKAAEMGIPFIAAVSALQPALLSRPLLGITLVAVVRQDRFEVFTRRNRIADL